MTVAGTAPAREAARIVDVVAGLVARIDPVGDVSLAVPTATGRVTAVPVTSPTDLPDVDRSAMDGFAVRSSDTAAAAPTRPVTLRVVGEHLAGGTTGGQVEPGCTVRIATGAVMPAGADAVVRKERATTGENTADVTVAVAPGTDVRRRGEEAAAGDVLLPAGRVLGVTQIGALAGVGVTHVAVRRRVRVALIVTGSEVFSGEIDDALGPALASLLGSPATEVTRHATVPDDDAALASALVEASATADVIVTTGGVSVGPADRLAAAVATVGSARRYFYDIHPGRPGAAGWIGDVPVLSLPGNPGAALLQTRLLVMPVIAALCGTTLTAPPQVRLCSPATGRDGRREFVPVSVGAEGATPVAGRGSGNLARLAATDGWVEVPADTERLDAGQFATLWRLPAWMS